MSAAPISRLALALAAYGALSCLAIGAQAQDLDKNQLKEWKKICLAWAEDHDDGARFIAENEAYTLDPIPAAAVEPLSEYLFELFMEYGPKLKKGGKDYFYKPEKRGKKRGKGAKGKGLYIVGKGKKGGGLMIAMHGGGEGQGDGGGAFSKWSMATKSGFTVIAPEVMEKVGSAWNEPKEETMVLELIDAAKRTFEIDTDRIVLAGHSMGGDASWMLGGRNADILASASPLAGSVMPYMKQGMLNRIDTPRDAYMGLMEGVLPNAMHLKYYIFHSDDDVNEAVHPDDIAVGYLKQLQKLFPGRYEHTYERTSGIGHGLPRKGLGYIIKWHAEQRRVAYPKEVVWETWWQWKRRMYWLYHPYPERAWRYHAKIVGDNHVDVTFTSKPEQGRTEPKEVDLRILCSPELFDMDKPLKVTSGKDVLFEGPIPRTLWAMLVSAGRRGDRKQWFEGHVEVKVKRQFWFDLWDWKKPK